MKTKSLVIALLASLIGGTVLTGCVPLVIGGAVGTAAFVTTDRRTTGTQMADEVMEKRIHYEISQAIPQNMHLTVTSYNRWVLLTGEVASEADKQLAERVARRSLEVSKVINELYVGPVTTVTQRMSDSTLASKVRSYIVGTKEVSLNQMKVVVDRDTVYLMGLLTQEEAARASEVVSRVKGVRSVVTVFEIITQAEVDRRLSLIQQEKIVQEQGLTTNNISTGTDASGDTGEVRIQ